MSTPRGAPSRSLIFMVDRMTATTAPRQYLPPEWAPQSAVMLTWPHPHGDWAPWIGRVEPVFVDIAAAVAAREQVLISCWDQVHVDHVKTLLKLRGVTEDRYTCYQVHSNDTWARDHGPITVLRDGRPVLLDFGFNGWGGKYDARLDNQISRHLHTLGAFGRTPLQTVDLVLEGGSIDVDGEGTLLTTRRCLLAPTRNPRLDRPQIEAVLHETLGLDRVLWLENGYLAGDDTDSHIDTLARFCDAQTIAYVACDDPADEHYAALKAMAEELRAFRTRTGEPYRLVPLPMTAPKFNNDGVRLPATYANFLIINGAVLVPTYNDAQDGTALARLAEAFPRHEIVPIDCSALVLQYGSLHCVTMQLPAGVVPA